MARPSHDLPDPIASRTPEGSVPALHLLLFEATPGGDDDTLQQWFVMHRDRVEGVPGLLCSRVLRLADEQLLPHRAARARQYAALHELASWDDLASAAKRLHPGSANDHSTVGLSGARSAAFVLVSDTVTPPTVPCDAPERPSRPAKRVNRRSGAFLALTRPRGVADEPAYNRWYDDHHLPETLLLDGVTRGRRYRRVAAPATVPGRPSIQAPYLTYYDLDDVSATAFNRDHLLPWLEAVSVDHFGPPPYDRSFTQAFVMQDIDADPAPRE